MMFSWLFCIAVSLGGISFCVGFFRGCFCFFLFCFQQVEMSLKHEISKGNFIFSYIFLF